MSWNVLGGELDTLLVVLTLEEALHIARWEVDIIWLEFSNWNDLLDFNNASLTSACHIWVEVSCCLSEDNVTELVSLPCLDERELTLESGLEDV